jgi:hypothetical protein
MRTQVELVEVYYARSHTRCYRVTISLVSKVGRPFIPSVIVLLCLAHSNGTKSLYDKIAVAKTAQDISSANIAGLPDSHYQYANTLTIREVCCSLVFVLLFSEFIELATIYRYKTVSQIVK